ncbi:MAG TPA: sigma-54 dependent transcriptional regulator [Thermoanaerobaculia bacterium]
MTRLLVVEDDGRLRASLLLQLREAGYAPSAAASAEEALAALDRDGRPDLLLVDVRLPGESGVDLVRRLAEAGRLPPTVVVSGEASIGETVEALRLGVHDFLEKPFGRERLLRSIENALEHASLRREVATLRQELSAERRLLGDSPPMARLRERIARAAPSEARVLVRGESGSGKELVAEAIHQGSPRRDGPFVRLNCAALPATLIEDELFGHVAGAFTDARADKRGLFEEADGGTLFLDEIGDMEPALQARLLRVLEDGAVRRLGETRPRRVDVRVIAATHRDLERAVAEGSFREDLYYRLAHLPIDVPPLRERPGDVELLFAHFLDRAARRDRQRRRGVDPRVPPLLAAYPWPGNVRELEHVCERLVVFGGDPIVPDDLPAPVLEGRPAIGMDGAGLAVVDLGARRLDLPLREFREACEREYVEAVLRRAGWNLAEAARRLGIGRTYLHEKVRRLGLRRPGASP